MREHYLLEFLSVLTIVLITWITLEKFFIYYSCIFHLISIIVLYYYAIISISVVPKITFGDKFKKPVCVQAGQNLSIDAELLGVPDVTVKWVKDNKELTTEENKLVEVNPKKTKIYIFQIKRKQRGIYNLYIENSAGKDDAKFEIDVKGKNTLFIH